MKKILFVLMAGGLIASCENAGESTQTEETNTTSSATTTEKNGESFTVAPGVFKDKMEKEPGTVLDVRTPGEVAEGTIPGAVVIDINDADFESRVNELDRTKPVYVYCKAGGRSAQATEIMMKNKFSKVYNLDGGIMAWMDEGFNVVKN